MMHGSTNIKLLTYQKRFVHPSSGSKQAKSNYYVTCVRFCTVTKCDHGGLTRMEDLNVLSCNVVIRTTFLAFSTSTVV